MSAYSIDINFGNLQNLLVPGQNKILYSLYGVVVHSGGLQGGHYIAYVKVNSLEYFDGNVLVFILDVCL